MFQIGAKFTVNGDERLATSGVIFNIKNSVLLFFG
jgi:hypothetical protein